MYNSESKSDIKNEDVSFYELFKSVLSKSWILLIVAVVVGSFAFFSAKSNQSHSYATSFKNYFYTEQDLTETKNGDLVSASASIDIKSLLHLYKYVATNDSILQSVIDTTNINSTVADLKSMLSISYDEKETFVNVTVSGSDPDIVYAVAESLNEITKQELMGKINNCKIETLVEPSAPAIEYHGKNPVKAAVLSALLSIFITAAAIIIIDTVQDKVKSPTQLEERSGIITMGTIPNEKKFSGRKA